MSDQPQHRRQDCYFCHEQDTHILEVHHIVPRRHGGSDNPANLVTVCPNCHERLERLYDARFYQLLGIGQTDTNSDDGGNELTPEMIETGDGEKSDEIETMKDLIQSIECEHPDGAPVDTVIKEAVDMGMGGEMASDEIEKLKQKGEAYEPQSGHLRTT